MRAELSRYPGQDLGRKIKNGRRRSWRQRRGSGSSCSSSVFLGRRPETLSVWNVSIRDASVTDCLLGSDGAVCDAVVMLQSGTLLRCREISAPCKTSEGGLSPV